jgi:hypothetical protein
VILARGLVVRHQILRTAFGLWRTAFGLWRTAFGLWRTAFGLWRTAEVRGRLPVLSYRREEAT